MLRFVSLVALTIGLSGCGMLPFDTMDGSEDPKPFPTTLGVSIPPSQAMAAMPSGAGQVISVIERRRSNAIQHDITLAGAPPNFGENQINVTAFRYVEDIPEKPLADKIKIERPTDSDIYNEMQERFPGGALPSSNAVPRNGMGTFGYAFGRRNGANCLYAWQWIEPAQARPFTPFNNKTAAPISVRVRMCRPGMTEEVMVDLVRQMFVSPRHDDSYRGNPTSRGPGPMAGYGGMGGRGLRGDALSAARPMTNGYASAYGNGYGNMATGYGDDAGYDRAYNYPKYQTAMATGYSPYAAVAAAPVRRKVRRVVVRRRVAPAATYSYSAPAASTPATTIVPGGYAAVPMPQ